MIDSPPTADRAVPSAVTNDRAIPAPEPLNRRGRRHLAGAIRRSERQIFRSLVRQESLERAGR